jgi:hypothetical protein
MNLYDLILLILLCLGLGLFWRFRGVSEAAKSHVEAYCEQKNIQMISIARTKTRVGSERGKLDLHCDFMFEFSGNGEDSNQGTLKMKGLKMANIELPAYRVH